MQEHLGQPMEEDAESVRRDAVEAPPRKPCYFEEYESITGFLYSLLQGLNTAHTVEHGSSALFILLCPPLTEQFYCVLRIWGVRRKTGGSFDVGHVLRFMCGVLSPLIPLFLSTQSWKELFLLFRYIKAVAERVPVCAAGEAVD